MHDDFALRHGDGDLVLFEQPPDGAIDFRAHVVDALLRILGSTSAARIRASRRPRAARRLPSWLRSLMDLNRMLPSSMSFWPASRRRRFLTFTGRLEFCGSRNLSCAALDTLLTFWPPGPEERMNFHSNSSSGMTMSGVMIRAIRKARNA